MWSAPFLFILYVADVVALLQFTPHHSGRVAHGDYAMCRSRSYVEHHAVELASDSFNELTTSSEIGSLDDRRAERGS